MVAGGWVEAAIVVSGCIEVARGVGVSGTFWVVACFCVVCTALDGLGGVLGVVSGAIGVVSGAIGVVSGAIGVVSGAIGVVSGAFGVVSGAIGVLPGATGVVSGAIGVVSGTIVVSGNAGVFLEKSGKTLTPLVEAGIGVKSGPCVPT